MTRAGTSEDNYDTVCEAVAEVGPACYGRRPLHPDHGAADETLHRRSKEPLIQMIGMSILSTKTQKQSEGGRRTPVSESEPVMRLEREAGPWGQAQKHGVLLKATKEL